MANFLDNLGLGGNGIEVYVSVSSTGKIEMCLPDEKTKEIKSYAQLPIEYNDSLREIANIDTFAKTIEQLFAECNINPQKANVHLSLPTVWFGYKDDVPLILDDNAVTNVIVGELEQTYVFKRKDPAPLWFEAASSDAQKKSVFYTAIQKETKDVISEAFSALGAKLVSITCSIFSDLKGLIRTGLIDEQVNNEDYVWNLMVINNTGFQLYGFKGKQFTDYVEEPLALKTYEGEEIYSAINNAAQISLMGVETNALVILSETDIVSAAYLAENLQLGAKIITVEDNKYKKEPLMNIGLNVIPENQVKVSLKILGLIGEPELLPIPTDFLAFGGQKQVIVETLEIPVTKTYTLVLTPIKALVYSGILFALVVLPILISMGVLTSMNNKATEEGERLNGELAAVEAELSQYTRKENKNQFDASQEIANVLKNNRTKVLAYASLGDSVPKNLYLTYFMTGDDGFIDIKGSANSVEDVYIFFKNLKDSLIDANLRLSKLDLKTGSLESVINSDQATNIDSAPYIFEITNMSDDQISSFMKALRASGKKNNNDGNNNGDSSDEPTN